MEMSHKTARNLILFVLLWGGLLLVLMSMPACNYQETTIPFSKDKEMVSGFAIRIYEFDGCEYVRFDAGDSSWGGHKGNCKNPIHKKENKTTVISDTIFSIKTEKVYNPIKNKVNVDWFD